jgi:hypothetical protein
MGAWKKRSDSTGQTGFSWIEFSVVASLLAVFAGSLLTALLYYEELAEAAVVQMTVQNIRSGLRYQIADRLVQGRSKELNQLLGENPISWLDSPPEGYSGSVRTSDVGAVQAGSWFYDVERNEVGYVPRHSMYLSLDAGGAAILRWKAEARRLEARGEVEGLMLVSLTPYRWF